MYVFYNIDVLTNYVVRESNIIERQMKIYTSLG